MQLTENIRNSIAEFMHSTYEWEGTANDIELQSTRKEFEGEFTFVAFPFLSTARKAAEVFAGEVGEHLVNSVEEVAEFNVVKGFLNLIISDKAWSDFTFSSLDKNVNPSVEKSDKILVEFCSPNTNKPLHLGHIRNILLGDSVSRILKAVGHEVINTQVINDRGIAICKSMIAWMKWGDTETPKSTGIKGDHFVGKFYVLFDKKIREEFKEWVENEDSENLLNIHPNLKEDQQLWYKNNKQNYFNNYSELGKETKELLLKWENEDEETREVWNKMNSWVLEGFERTFESLEVQFDKNYFESDTYLLGKEVVEEGVGKGVFTKGEDGSIWADLTDVNLDEKILRRADGTSLYITQDLGTAQIRYDDYGMDRMIYVVGDEQEYHFQVLFELLKRLDVPYSDGLFHLSYGMVDLPSGKMKSREGNVVDADDLIKEVIEEAHTNAQERGELDQVSAEEREEIIRNVAMGALKFYILQVNPRKRMVFDPEQSVDLQGHTGPYIQNAYVRIQSLLRKQEEKPTIEDISKITLNTYERSLLMKLHSTKDRIMQAAENYDPSHVADQAYTIGKAFHKFYHEVPILRSEDEETKAFRIALCRLTAQQLKYLFKLINVEMPERM